jgi:hypothetical protein
VRLTVWCAPACMCSAQHTTSIVALDLVVYGVKGLQHGSTVAAAAAESRCNYTIVGAV